MEFIAMYLQHRIGYKRVCILIYEDTRWRYCKVATTQCFQSCGRRRKNLQTKFRGGFEQKIEEGYLKR